MKIAITGGAGFIGSHLAKTYLDAGHDVLVIDNLVRGSRQALDSRARFYQLDIRASNLGTILQQERPDIVSHHAAQREQQNGVPVEQSLADADVNVRGLLNVLECCVQASVGKFIFASGGNTMYGSVEAHQLPITEDTPLCPQRPHDISKVAGEWYVRYYSHHFGLKHTILRYADVYGDASNQLSVHPLHYFLNTLFKQQRPVIRGSSDEARDHIFIDDVVRANLCVLERGHDQTFHISSAHGYTLNELYYMVANLLESDILPTYISGTLVEAHSIVLDNTRAQRVLGWRTETSTAEGIWRTSLRLREQGEADQKTFTKLVAAGTPALIQA